VFLTELVCPVNRILCDHGSRTAIIQFVACKDVLERWNCTKVLMEFWKRRATRKKWTLVPE